MRVMYRCNCCGEIIREGEHCVLNHIRHGVVKSSVTGVYDGNGGVVYSDFRKGIESEKIIYSEKGVYDAYERVKEQRYINGVMVDNFYMFLRGMLFDSVHSSGIYNSEFAEILRLFSEEDEITRVKYKECVDTTYIYNINKTEELNDMFYSGYIVSVKSYIKCIIWLVERERVKSTVLNEWLCMKREEYNSNIHIEYETSSGIAAHHSHCEGFDSCYNIETEVSETIYENVEPLKYCITKSGKYKSNHIFRGKLIYNNVEVYGYLIRDIGYKTINGIESLDGKILWKVDENTLQCVTRYGAFFR